MVSMRFKTNVQCNHCKESIRSGMEDITEVVSWEVDLEDPDRVMRVQAIEPVHNKVLRVLQEAGYSGQIIVEA